jgi:oligogalacturonide lyase
MTWFGYVKHDGTGETESVNCKHPRNTPDHIHSLDDTIFCSDTGKSINIFKNTNGIFDGPRTLCMHDGTFFWGSHHPHPRITPDKKHVVYNSSSLGYCNIFMAEIPQDFDSLPKQA